MSLYLINKLSNKIMEVNNFLLNEIETLNKSCRTAKAKKSNTCLTQSYQTSSSQHTKIDHP